MRCRGYYTVLKDTLLNWCKKKLEDSCAGHCGSQCNNKDSCEQDCDKCLDQVHWLQNDKGRRDYDCPLLLLRYVLRFIDKYSEQIHSALRNVDLSKYPRYHIFSIGCGAAPDLMAIEEINYGKPIYYKGYDRNRLWADIHNEIESYAEYTDYFEAKLRQYDIFDVFAEGKPHNQQYNIVVIQYLLSHLYNIGQEHQIGMLFDYIITNILAKRLANSPFLIIITDIDSMYKGRNTWYTLLDKLEDAGYWGTAYARSAFPAGDLGQERWSDYRHKMTPAFERITYNYSENNSEHDGAQLVIELR